MSVTISNAENLDFYCNRQLVLKGVNLNIKSGDFMAMIGPNGGGKTTLLKPMLGLLKAYSGTIQILAKTPQSERLVRSS
jgi:zinc transport system ATP-binding protein